MENDYTGVFAVPESDILPNRSTVNPSFNEYVWRVRSGNGSGPTGSPGTPEGWSQNAPQYAEGVQFDVSTAGYSNITLHFDWTQGGISNMQAQYSPDGGSTWVNAPGTIQAISNDYYGITSTTNPTGIFVNLQGIAAVNNNPNFELRLVSAYNPSLPLINDGNQLVPGLHGQYAGGIAAPVNAQQVIQFDTGVSGGTFTLSYNGQTTSPIAYSTTPATLITNITNALTPLVGSANFSVAQTNTPGVNPERDGLGNTNTDMTVTFKGTLAATAVTTMTSDGSLLTGGGSVTVATWVNGSALGFKPYVDGGGAWQFGNISFNGDSTATGGTGHHHPAGCRHRHRRNDRHLHRQRLR